MGSIKRGLTEVGMSINGMDTKLIRYKNILKYKKDKETVVQIIADLQKIEKKINRLRMRQGTQDIFKQP